MQGGDGVIDAQRNHRAARAMEHYPFFGARVAQPCAGSLHRCLRQRGAPWEARKSLNERPRDRACDVATGGMRRAFQHQLAGRLIAGGLQPLQRRAQARDPDRVPCTDHGARLFHDTRAHSLLTCALDRTGLMTCAAWDASKLPPAGSAPLPALPEAAPLLGIPHALFVVQQAAALTGASEEAVAFRFALALAAALPEDATRSLPGSDARSIAFIHRVFASEGGCRRSPDAAYVHLVDAARRAGLPVDPCDFVPAAFAASEWATRVPGPPPAFGCGDAREGAPLQPLALKTAAEAVGRLLEARSEIAAEKRFRAFEAANSLHDLLPWRLATIDATMPLSVLASRMGALAPEALHGALCGALLASGAAEARESRAAAWRAAAPYSPALAPGIPHTPAGVASALGAFYAQFGAPEPLAPDAPMFGAHILVA